MIELQSDIGLKKTRGRGNFEIKLTMKCGESCSPKYLQQVSTLYFNQVFFIIKVRN